MATDILGISAYAKTFLVEDMFRTREQVRFTSHQFKGQTKHLTGKYYRQTVEVR